MPAPTTTPRPDRETLLAFMSALLDGELPVEDEVVLFGAMAHDPTLESEFEGLIATRAAFEGQLGLGDDDAAALTASVLAAVAPAQMSATVAGVQALASAHADDALSVDGSAHLQSLLDTPALAAAATGFVHTSEATHAFAQGLAELPVPAHAFHKMATHVLDVVDAREQAGMRMAAWLDGEAELAANDDVTDVQSVAAQVFVGEALYATRDAPAFAPFAARAGDAALHAIEAERLRAVVPAAARTVTSTVSISIWTRLRTIVFGTGAPLALAGAAAFGFLVLRAAPTPGTGLVDTHLAQNDSRAVLFNALTAMIKSEPDAPPELPVLANNTADVEALDANDAALVFQTPETNITVIWVQDPEEQGT